MTVWVTFAPSFLWIFAGAPFLDDLRRNPRVAGALAAITAAVVGVVAHLALWFALNVLFASVRETDGRAAASDLRRSGQHAARRARALGAGRGLDLLLAPRRRVHGRGAGGGRCRVDAFGVARLAAHDPEIRVAARRSER